jgi:hypothetical protein
MIAFPKRFLTRHFRRDGLRNGVFDIAAIVKKMFASARLIVSSCCPQEQLPARTAPEPADLKRVNVKACPATPLNKSRPSLMALNQDFNWKTGLACPILLCPSLILRGRNR